MWDILLAAAVGAVVSLLGWGLRSLWEARRSRIRIRRQYAADVLDSGVFDRIDSFAENHLSGDTVYEAVKSVPRPPTLADIEAGGKLTAARHQIIAQLRVLYDLRVSENASGRYFSSAFDAELVAFRQRLSRWAGKSRATEDLLERRP